MRQDEETNPKAADLKRGTVKAAVLEGDADCPSLVAFSIYDTKPVHFLMMACTSIKWHEMEKLVYDKMSNQKVRMKFLRSGLIDNYNNGMNKVDQADQLHGSYRFDHWICKRKWWWAIWLWGVQVLVINAYVLYKTAHEVLW